MDERRGGGTRDRERRCQSERDGQGWHEQTRDGKGAPEGMRDGERQHEAAQGGVSGERRGRGRAQARAGECESESESLKRENSQKLARKKMGNKTYLCQRFRSTLKARRWAFSLGLFPLQGRWYASHSSTSCFLVMTELTRGGLVTKTSKKERQRTKGKGREEREETNE